MEVNLELFNVIQIRNTRRLKGSRRLSVIKRVEGHESTKEGEEEEVVE